MQLKSAGHTRSAIIQRILIHLGLWHVLARAQRAPTPSPAEITFDYSVADEPAAYDETPAVTAGRSVAGGPPAAGAALRRVQVCLPPTQKETLALKRGRPVGPEPTRIPAPVRSPTFPLVHGQNFQIYLEIFWFSLPKCDRVLLG